MKSFRSWLRNFWGEAVDATTGDPKLLTNDNGDDPVMSEAEYLRAEIQIAKLLDVTAKATYKNTYSPDALDSQIRVLTKLKEKGPGGIVSAKSAKGTHVWFNGTPDEFERCIDNELKPELERLQARQQRHLDAGGEEFKVEIQETTSNDDDDQ